MCQSWITRLLHEGKCTVASFALASRLRPKAVPSESLTRSTYLLQLSVPESHPLYVPGLLGLASNQLPLLPYTEVSTVESQLLPATSAELQEPVFSRR